MAMGTTGTTAAMVTTRAAGVTTTVTRAIATTTITTGATTTAATAVGAIESRVLLRHPRQNLQPERHYVTRDSIIRIRPSGLQHQREFASSLAVASAVFAGCRSTGARRKGKPVGPPELFLSAIPGNTRMRGPGHPAEPPGCSGERVYRSRRRSRSRGDGKNPAPPGPAHPVLKVHVSPRVPDAVLLWSAIQESKQQNLSLGYCGWMRFAATGAAGNAGAAALESAPISSGQGGPPGPTCRRRMAPLDRAPCRHESPAIDGGTTCPGALLTPALPPLSAQFHATPPKRSTARAGNTARARSGYRGRSPRDA